MAAGGRPASFRYPPRNVTGADMMLRHQLAILIARGAVETGPPGQTEAERLLAARWCIHY